MSLKEIFERMNEFYRGHIKGRYCGGAVHATNAVCIFAAPVLV
jgi:hypothetical protein